VSLNYTTDEEKTDEGVVGTIRDGGRQGTEHAVYPRAKLVRNKATGLRGVSIQ
jgi:hypothetical protein